MAHGDSKRYKSRSRGCVSQINLYAQNRKTARNYMDNFALFGTDEQLVVYDDWQLVIAYELMNSTTFKGKYFLMKLREKIGSAEMLKLKNAYEAAKEREKAASELYDQQMCQEVKDREKKLVVDKAEMLQHAKLSAGLLQSDIANITALKESYGEPDGEWLDDPVQVYIDGHGWGMETEKVSGFKLQITLSLDCSNSMINNRISTDASTAFRHLHFSIEELQKMFPGSIFYEAFYFSLGDDGKRAGRVVKKPWKNEDKEYYLDKMEPYREGSEHSVFRGEDTWLHPLLDRISRWESRYSDPNAYRLDLIISDAVLDHKTDIRKCSDIQDHRDGALQTFILNILPRTEWRDIRLPSRVIQYAISAENLEGMLRKLLSDHLSVIV